MSDFDEPKSMSDAIDSAQLADATPEEQEAIRAEQKVVKKLWKEYKQSRDFDEPARRQYVIDRRYAAGKADATWAVSSNLIGNIIDILASFLYARDPDVSCKKAKQVTASGTKDLDLFAQTMELVVSSLWKKGKLKPQAKKLVRSALSVGVGWLKAVLICDAPVNAEMNEQLNDLKDNMAALAEVEEQLRTIEGADMEDIEAKIAKQQELITSLENKIEATIRKYIAIDFVPAQDMSTALDVAATEDYLDADWNANAIYVLKDKLREKFPRLTEEEVKQATTYFQRREQDTTPISDRVSLPGIDSSGVDAKDADYYTTSGVSKVGVNPSDSGPEFAKVVELWDKRTNHIKTMVEGIKRWAKEPFQPPYPTSRFYPYFRVAFFEVDGERHPQSLAWRLCKLQDEYCRSRSNFRLTRERSIPGVIFNQANLTPEDAEKIRKGVHQEMIGLSPVDPTVAINQMFSSKPTGDYDPRIFDNGPILADMEKISGVQEALQSSATPDKTATQANIEQSGFASRTTADRDTIEDMLSDLANYTGESALTGLLPKDAQRIAGPGAFWPHGMAVDDLVTMVELDIKAGTTGKPNEQAKQQAWGVLLPVIKEAIIQIHEVLATGNIPLAKALSEVVKRTMSIMGDDTDPDVFIPEIPDVPMMGDPLAPAPAGGAPLPGADPSLPPMAGSDEGAPPIQNPELAPPALEVPAL